MTDSTKPQLRPFPPLPNDEVYTSTHWRVVANLNQARLGAMLLITQRETFDLFALSDDEKSALWTVMAICKDVLGFCFQPTNVNYEFRMNQRWHVHMHAIPRYLEEPPMFAGIVFPDEPRIVSRRMPPEIHQEIVRWLRKGFERITSEQN